MRRGVGLFCLIGLMSLSACTTLDIAGAVLSTAGMAHSYEKQETQRNFQRYEEACKWPRFNALQLAQEAEAKKLLPDAYHMYSLAAFHGYPSGPKLAALRQVMTEVEVDYVEDNIARHTPQNIRQCYFVSADRWNR